MGFLLGLVLMAGVGYSQLVQEYQVRWCPRLFPSQRKR
jgi:hypothetical protein